jgi:hypothetical protein
MKIKFLILSVLSTIAVLGILPIPSSITQIEVSAAQTVTKFKTYVSPKIFSIQYPSAWNVDGTNRKYVMITNYKPKLGGGTAPANFVKTDISFVSGSLETAFNRTISNSTDNYSTITKRERLTIGGRQALRLWITSSGFDFPDIVSTYIRYKNNETAVVSSFYTRSNSSALGNIQRIHSSFRVIKY